MHCSRAPRKLRGFSRLLSRHDLAPRAGDTSGRLRAPWLPEDRHDQRLPSTASSSPADRAPPQPALRPPLAGTAPGRGRLLRLAAQAGRPCGKWGGEVTPPESPRTEDLDARRPTRQSRVPSTQSHSSSYPPSPSNFPFSSSGRSDPLPALPPAKTGAGSPLPAARLSGRAPAAVHRPATGLSLLTRNLGRDRL